MVVEREWRVEFKRQGQGISVVGDQIGVIVETPPGLETLAAIEKSRSTQTMWPILLSSSGQMVASGEYAAEADIDRAMHAAREIIEKEPDGAQSEFERLQHLRQFEQAGSRLLDHMPGDLFFPSGKPQHDVRRMDLGGGFIGEYELIYTSRINPGASWLERAERQVITRIADSEKRMREEWTLRPA